MVNPININFVIGNLLEHGTKQLKLLFYGMRYDRH